MNTNKEYESSNLNNFNHNNNNPKSDSKINTEKPYKKKNNKIFENSNESNEITSNFTDFINLDKNYINRNSRTIENYINNERLKNKRSSQLEIRDFEYNEVDFKEANKIDENSKHAINKEKSLSSSTALKQNERNNKNFIKSNSLYNDEISKRSHFTINSNEDSNIFEKLSNLKLRTKCVLSLYTENLFKKNNVN